MLKKVYRLKKSSAFKATYKLKNSFYNNGLTIFCGKEKNNNVPTKFGFVVSKKIHKRAVKRNRIKRLMREVVRQYLISTTIPTKYISIIFIASTKLLDKDLNYIQESFQNLVNKI